MLRKVLGIVAGLVVTNALVISAQTLNSLIYPIPRDVAWNEPAAVSAYMAALPAGAFALVLIGYVFGYFVGGFVIRKISLSPSLTLPLILGGLGTLGWALNVAMLPHPIWVTVLGFLCFIPFALLGHRAGAK